MITLERLRDLTVQALRNIGRTTAEQDDRIADMRSEIDDLHARITSLEAAIADLDD